MEAAPRYLMASRCTDDELIIDLHTDRHAKAMLILYGRLIQTEHPRLARDLRARAVHMEVNRNGL